MVKKVCAHESRMKTNAAVGAAAARGGLEKYAVLELVGEGSFGKVYRGRIKVSLYIYIHAQMPVLSSYLLTQPHNCIHA